MKISSTRTQIKDLRLGFIEPAGRILPAYPGYLENIPDKYASHISLKNLETAGLVTISDFSTAEEESSVNEPLVYVSDVEFKQIVQGLYKATWAKDGTLAQGTAYSLTSSLDTTYTVTYKNLVPLLVDGLISVTVTLTPGRYTVANLVSALNGDTEFAKYLVASNAATHLKITTKSLGVNASVAFVTNALSAVNELGMASPTIVAGTGTVATITITTVGPVGVGMKDVVHEVKLYDAVSGGSLSTIYQIQRVTSGTLVSGYLSNDLVVKSGPAGVTTFEIVGTAAATVDCYAEIVDVSATHYLANIPSSRLEILNVP